MDIGAATWRQVGDKVSEDEVNIAKGEAKMEQKRQEAAKRLKNARIQRRRSKIKKKYVKFGIVKIIWV